MPERNILVRPYSPPTGSYTTPVLTLNVILAVLVSQRFLLLRLAFMSLRPVLFLMLIGQSLCLSGQFKQPFPPVVNFLLDIIDEMPVLIVKRVLNLPWGFRNSSIGSLFSACMLSCILHLPLHTTATGRYQPQACLSTSGQVYCSAIPSGMVQSRLRTRDPFCKAPFQPSHRGPSYFLSLPIGRRREYDAPPLPR